VLAARWVRWPALDATRRLADAAGIAFDTARRPASIHRTHRIHESHGIGHLMADRLQRITIGFHGQALAARVVPDQLAALRKALDNGGEGWHELEAEDGTIALALAKVVFVRVEADDQRVGFGI
jgi:hypothetical protein